MIPTIEASKFCKATVAVSSTRGRATNVVTDTENMKMIVTYKEFVDSAATDERDAAYICTPNALHLPYVEAAADHSKVILL